MHRFIPIMSLIGCLALSTLARGQGAVRQPVVPKGVAGYTVTIQDQWVNGGQGFCPVRVNIKTNPANNVVNDTLFTVSINRRSYQNSSSVVSAPLMIPAGKNSGSVELYLDLGSSGNAYSQEILVEKGDYDGQLNRRDLLKASCPRGDYYGVQPALLFVSSSFNQVSERSWVCYQDKMRDTGSSRATFVSDDPIPRIDELSSIYHQENPGMAQPQKKTTAATPPGMVIANNERIHGIHPNYLPESWIGLSSVDQILISMSDFKSVCLKQDADRARIEQWVVAGGILIVFDTGPGFQEADKIWPFLLGSDRAPAGDRSFSEWMVPDSEVKNLKRMLPRPNTNQYYYDQDQAIWFDTDGREMVGIKNDVKQWEKFAKPSLISADNQPANQGQADNKTAKAIHKFAISGYVNGQIIAVNDDLSAWNSDDWRGLQNAIVATGRDMSTQIGVSTGLVEMPGFAIPGVGEPPIKMFQILIGLFLLLAGPVMLIVLKRTEQMQYLFVAVPLLSLTVCLSLFLYAILVDGSNRWGRTQTVTTMDHRTNMSVTHSRTNYYSGKHPGRYVSPADTMTMVAMDEVRNPLFSRFAAGKQEVWGGNIRPRMPHEVVSIRSQMARQRLVLIPATSNSSDDSPSIKNLLGADVALVMFRTDLGLFMIEDLKAEETRVAIKIDESIAKAKSRVQIRNLNPHLDGVFPGLGRGYSRGYYYGQAQNYEYATFGDDALVIEQIRTNRISELITTPKTYVAILENFPLAAEQIEPVEYKLQVHVVRGQW